ncbi:MAG: hypothetical protein OET44_03535 [Gammaproteobacteria bacterium]|nr:hypothetical protein [Gammaproteobacteria bacterium]
MATVSSAQLLTGRHYTDVDREKSHRVITAFPTSFTARAVCGMLSVEVLRADQRLMASHQLMDHMEINYG